MLRNSLFKELVYYYESSMHDRQWGKVPVRVKEMESPYRNGKRHQLNAEGCLWRHLASKRRSKDQMSIRDRSSGAILASMMGCESPYCWVDGNFYPFLLEWRVTPTLHRLMRSVFRHNLNPLNQANWNEHTLLDPHLGGTVLWCRFESCCWCVWEDSRGSQVVGPLLPMWETRWNSGFLVSSWASPSRWGHLRNEQRMVNLSASTLYNSALEISKQNLKEKKRKTICQLCGQLPSPPPRSVCQLPQEAPAFITNFPWLTLGVQVEFLFSVGMEPSLSSRCSATSCMET